MKHVRGGVKSREKEARFVREGAWCVVWVTVNDVLVAEPGTVRFVAVLPSSHGLSVLRFSLFPRGEGSGENDRIDHFSARIPCVSRVLLCCICVSPTLDGKPLETMTYSCRNSTKMVPST